MHMRELSPPPWTSVSEPSVVAAAPPKYRSASFRKFRLTRGVCSVTMGQNGGGNGEGDRDVCR